MKTVRLPRHGESAANAGAASRDHASIPLTDKGIGQAQCVARSFDHAPARIVASAFSRAQDTARATAAMYPGVPFETWPIEEFTDLDPARCMGTTVAQRQGWVQVYWNRAQPCYSDGEGAGSFMLSLPGRNHFWSASQRIRLSTSRCSHTASSSVRLPSCSNKSHSTSTAMP